MQRTFKSTAAVLLLGACTLCAQAAELVTNGDFETDSFVGWTHSGNTTFSGVGITLGGAGHGLYDAFLGPYGSTGVLSQNLATVVGELYAISFELQNDGGTLNSFMAQIGGATLLPLSNAQAFSYFRFSSSFTATAENTLLSFTVRHDPKYFHLDNVSVTGLQAPVPEPESSAMLLAGLGVMGYLARRRKPQPARQ